MQSPSEPPFVSLPGPPGYGLTAPRDAVVLLWSLEARHFRLSRDGDVLLVAPAEQLTDDDRARIRRWKWHLIAMLDYRAPEVA